MDSIKYIELFGKQIEIRSTDCQLFDNPIVVLDEPHVNLFIQLNNTCNANCLFCEYHGENRINNWNYSKLADIIKEIQSKAKIGKLNFTGGEPTINMTHFDKVMQTCMDNTKDYYWEVTINTNGIHLLELTNYMQYIDYISLSRHHYDDEKNYEIFRSKQVPSSADIQKFILDYRKYSKSAVTGKNFGNPYQLNGRCNLIKGYIDSTEEIKNYLDWCGLVGMRWIGLVTLMPLNDYCKTHETCADSLINNVPGFRQTQLWQRIESKGLDSSVECRCANYMHNTHGKLILFYHRIFCNNNLKAGQLVYDGQDLRLGFGGEIIY